MFLTKISIERPRMLIMIVLALVIFGALSYFSLPVTLMPDINLPYVTVQTVYPGAGPKEIETQITKPIEDAVSTIAGIKEMTSYSLDNVGIMVIEFEPEIDVNFAKMDVKDNVDAIISKLPTDAQKPVVKSFDVGADNIIELSFVGQMSSRELYEYADKYMKDRLSQIKGVAQLTISGGQAREIHVKFDRRVLENYGMSLMQVVSFLASQNINMPGGYISEAGSEYTIRLDGEYKSIEEINELEISTRYGIQTLKNIAKIVDAQEDVREKAKYFSHSLKGSDNLNTINIGIQKASDANEVETAALTKAEVESMKKDLPPGTELYISQDNSIYTKGSKEDTVSNIIIGIILTGLVLLLFLHDIRSTIIVGVSMPIAIIITFIFIRVSGFSVNMMTLMALSTSVGILVANSIVVIENIYRHAEMGESLKKSSLIGTSEIVIAVSATTLTNVVVFLPLQICQVSLVSFSSSSV
jgi:HAE1 family hydrophobic/amphiphilic exporter-1